jgi:hypothetical protein
MQQIKEEIDLFAGSEMHWRWIIFENGIMQTSLVRFELGRIPYILSFSQSLVAQKELTQQDKE